MKEIVSSKFFALYSQIEINDIESSEPFPEWVTGDENAVMNSKGVAVSTIGDALVDVVVYEGEGEVEGTEYISGVINVGNKGLQVGNMLAASYSIYPWPAGRTMVKVFANMPNGKATKVSFLLQHLGE